MCIRDSLWIVVVAHHDSRTFDTQLPHLALDNRAVPFVYDLGCPAIAGEPNSPYLVDVLHSQVDTARASGLGQAIIGIIFVAVSYTHLCSSSAWSRRRRFSRRSCFSCSRWS